MKDLKIHATCRCEECNGRGYQDSHLWLCFHDANEEWKEKNPKPMSSHAGAIDPWYDDLERFEEKWWSEQGYSLKSLPPEEYPCPNCQGSGFQEVSLTLEQLASLLDREETA